MIDERDLMPLLSPAALKAVTDHCEALEAMAASKKLRLVANGLRLLLDNHERRAKALREPNHGGAIADAARDLSAMTNTPPTCATCPYWNHLRDPKDRKNHLEFLSCRRHAPTRDGATPKWPETGSGDWCGDHPTFPEYLRSMGGEVKKESYHLVEKKIDSIVCSCGNNDPDKFQPLVKTQGRTSATLWGVKCDACGTEHAFE